MTIRTTRRNTVVALLQTGQRFLFLTHENPDTDGAAALSALALLLSAEGKQTVAYVTSPVSNAVDALATPDLFSTEWPAGFSPDVIVTFDASSIPHLGKTAAALLPSRGETPILNIDHHATNARFGSRGLNLVDPRASSTCEVVYGLATKAKLPLTAEVATLLLMGIIADTGRLQYANTRKKTLRVVGNLMSAGANLADINEQAQKYFTLDGIHLFGDVLTRATAVVDGRVVWADVTPEMMSRSPMASKVVSGELFDFLLRSADCTLAIVFAARGDGDTQVHLRSTANTDCTVIAKHFGGGGHKRAAGCTVQSSLDRAEKAVLEFVTANYAAISGEDAPLGGDDRHEPV